MTKFENVGKVLDLNRKYVQRLPAYFRRVLRTFGQQGPTLRELRHAAADGYLQKQFNLEPLISDITGISRALYKLEADMRRLLSQAGRLQRKHYKFAWQEYESPTLYVKTVPNISLNLGQFAGSTTPAGYTGVSNAHGMVFSCTRRTTHYVPTIFHAEIEYSYFLSQFQVEHARLLVLLDAMGINLNPTIIWNAIPWSFVVDWVFSVGKWLDQSKVINMEPQVSVHRYLWSWTRHRRTSTYFRSTSTPQSGNYWQPAIVDTYLPTLYETTYRRDIELPTSTTSLFGSGLNAVELSLGVALANTPVRRPRNRVRL